MSSSEPVKYDTKDGQWYTHVGVDVKDTQGRKGICKDFNVPLVYSNCRRICLSPCMITCN